MSGSKIHHHRHEVEERARDQGAKRGKEKSGRKYALSHGILCSVALFNKFVKTDNSAAQKQAISKAKIFWFHAN